MDEGRKYARKTLPVALKKYVESKPKSVIIYSGQYFATFSFLEFIQLYCTSGTKVSQCLNLTLGKIWHGKRYIVQTTNRSFITFLLLLFQSF